MDSAILHPLASAKHAPHNFPRTLCEVPLLHNPVCCFKTLSVRHRHPAVVKALRLGAFPSHSYAQTASFLTHLPHSAHHVPPR